MGIKPEDKVLTYEQAKELKFFMRNCTGTRQDLYNLLDQMLEFKKRLDRLNDTCEMIEKYFGKEIEEWEKLYSGKPYGPQGEALLKATNELLDDPSAIDSFIKNHPKQQGEFP